MTEVLTPDSWTKHSFESALFNELFSLIENSDHYIIQLLCFMKGFEEHEVSNDRIAKISHTSAKQLIGYCAVLFHDLCH